MPLSSRCVSGRQSDFLGGAENGKVMQRWCSKKDATSCARVVGMDGSLPSLRFQLRFGLWPRWRDGCMSVIGAFCRAPGNPIGFSDPSRIAMHVLLKPEFACLARAFFALVVPVRLAAALAATQLRRGRSSLCESDVARKTHSPVTAVHEGPDGPAQGRRAPPPDRRPSSRCLENTAIAAAPGCPACRHDRRTCPGRTDAAPCLRQTPHLPGWGRPIAIAAVRR